MTELDTRYYIAKTIRVYLRRKGWTRKDLAKATGISEKTIGKYVNATVEPSLSNILKISDALGVEIIHINDIL